MAPNLVSERYEGIEQGVGREREEKKRKTPLYQHSSPSPLTIWR
jgi:hypothetical protein